MKMKYFLSEKKQAIFEDKERVATFRVRVWSSRQDPNIRLCKPLNAGAIFRVISEDKTHVLIERLK